MRIKRRVIEDAVERAVRDSPREACGVLIAEGDLIVEAVGLANESRAPDRFELHALGAAAAERRARETGRRLTGYFHSHADGDILPSESDRLGVLWPELPPFLHLIVSPDGRWELYNMRGGAWRRQEVAIED